MRRISIYYVSIKNRCRNSVGTILHSFGTSMFLQLLRRNYKRSTFMSLDLHTSVTRDLIVPFQMNNIDLERWTISASSHLFGEPNLRTAHIRGANWKKLDQIAITRFLNRYHRALDRYSGYVVSYTFSFLQIFESLKKPILAINATRYESPYTLHKDQYDYLNNCIQELVVSNRLTIVSNNIGDRDYLNYFTGIESFYIPNLCNYVAKHSPQGLPWVIHSRNLELANMLASNVRNAATQESVFPTGFEHEDFAKYAGVILIPYNISTMRLFELTTAGFPVRIPSDRLLKEWASMPGVLSELSWVQVLADSCPKWLLNTPADPGWADFLDWWLERADWNNPFFFPNVTRFDSVEELNFPPKPFLMKDIELRNAQIKSEWEELIALFLRTQCQN